MAMDEDAMMDLYEELVEFLQTLNKEAPAIRELYENAEDELERSIKSIKNAAMDAKDELIKAEMSGLDKITDLSSNRKEQIDEQIKALNDVVKKASKVQEALGITTEFVQQTNKQFTEMSHLLDLIKKSVDEQQQRYSKMEERLSALEDKVDEISPIEIDYDELIPALDLYNKYNDRINRPIVLEKKNYTNDYCFRVNGIDEKQEALLGRYFRKGKLYGVQSTFPFSTKCKMFNGDTLDDVIAAEI